MSSTALSAMRFGIAAAVFAPYVWRGLKLPHVRNNAAELALWLFGRSKHDVFVLSRSGHLQKHALIHNSSWPLHCALPCTLALSSCMPLHAFASPSTWHQTMMLDPSAVLPSLRSRQAC